MYIRDPNTTVTLGEQLQKHQLALPEYCRARTEIRNQIEKQVKYYNNLLCQKKARINEREDNKADFAIGDLVWLYVNPHVEAKKSRKFTTSWTGPYRIMMIISNTQIIIKDIYSKKMKTTHISRIKKVTNVRKPIENNKLRKKEKKLQTLGDFEVERIVDGRTDEQLFMRSYAKKECTKVRGHMAGSISPRK